MTASSAFDEQSRLRVAIGLGLIYAGLCITVLAFLWFFLGPLLMLRIQNAALLKLFRAHVAIVAGMFLLAIALGIVGRLLCLATPRQAIGTLFWGVMLVAVCVDLLGVAVFGTTFLHFYWPQIPTLKFLEDWAMVLSISGHCCFLVFLWRLAVVIERKGLSILAIVAAAIFVAFACLMQMWLQWNALAGANPQMVVEKMAILVGVGLVAIFTYGNLLVYLRRAVREKSPAAAEAASESKEAG